MQRAQNPKAKKREENKEFVPLKMYSSRGFQKGLPKPMSAPALASGLVKQQGYENAHRIAEFHTRETIGAPPHASVNVHRPYYLQVLAHIKKINPKNRQA